MSQKYITISNSFSWIRGRTEDNKINPSCKRHCIANNIYKWISLVKALHSTHPWEFHVCLGAYLLYAYYKETCKLQNKFY